MELLVLLRASGAVAIFILRLMDKSRFGFSSETSLRVLE